MVRNICLCCVNVQVSKILSDSHLCCVLNICTVKKLTVTVVFSVSVCSK